MYLYEEPLVGAVEFVDDGGGVGRADLVVEAQGLQVAGHRGVVGRVHEKLGLVTGLHFFDYLLEQGTYQTEKFTKQQKKKKNHFSVTFL